MQQGKVRSKKTPLLLRPITPDPLDALAGRVVLFLLLFVIPGFSLVPALALAAVPVMMIGFLWSTLKSAPGTRILAAASVIAVLSGLLLRLISVDSGVEASGGMQLGLVILWVAAFPALVLAGYWALERVDFFSGMRAAFLGATLSVLVTGDFESWKGDLGIYMTLFLLAVSARHVRWTRLILIGSAFGNAVSDSRTMALICAIVFLCTFVTRRQVAWVKKQPRRAMVLILGGFLVLSYAMSQAMLSGLLGEAIRLRTMHQVSGGRDLITAGRTEWAATLDLFKQQPWGFGIGVTPPPGLRRDALGAVQMAGGDYTNMAYWQHSVFGERTDLHSTTADLWAHFGIGGVIMAAALAAVLARGLPHAVSYIRALGAAPLFAILAAAWDVLFSPMGNSDRIISGLLLAVVLIKLHATPPLIPEEPKKKFRLRKLTHYEATLEKIAQERAVAAQVT